MAVPGVAFAGGGPCLACGPLAVAWCPAAFTFRVLASPPFVPVLCAFVCAQLRHLKRIKKATGGDGPGVGGQGAPTVLLLVCAADAMAAMDPGIRASLDASSLALVDVKVLAKGPPGGMRGCAS